jgi:quercetin dioxygenase-like cupin family protein
MNDAPLEIVARNVRTARVAAGLSLEGARGNPNFTTLVRLADALGRSVSSLMEDAQEEALVVVADAEDVAPLWAGPAGGTARLLLTNPRPTPVEVWRWRLHPGERHDSHAHQAGVTETLTVVRGQMRLVVGDVVRPLRAGDTAVFAADVPHAYEGAGRGPCDLVMTVHLPPEHRGA